MTVFISLFKCFSALACHTSIKANRMEQSACWRWWSEQNPTKPGGFLLWACTKPEVPVAFYFHGKCKSASASFDQLLNRETSPSSQQVARPDQSVFDRNQERKARQQLHFVNIHRILYKGRFCCCEKKNGITALLFNDWVIHLHKTCFFWGYN